MTVAGTRTIVAGLLRHCEVTTNAANSFLF